VQLRAIAVQSMGFAAPVMRPERLESAVPRVLPTVLGMARRDEDRLFAMQGLAQLLDSAAAVCPAALEPHMPVRCALFLSVAHDRVSVA
jgi:hypothetical protein